jgi:putative Mg2+ transporter-C (MgtC) family protein
VTTAATIWLVTVIGLCFGGGQIGLVVAGTIIAMATLWLLKNVKSFVVNRRRGTIAVTLSADGPREPALLAPLAAHGFTLRSRSVELLPGEETRVTCSGRYKGDHPRWSSALLRELSEHAGVTRVEWRDTD